MSRLLGTVLAAALVAVAATSAARAGEPEWIRQFGSDTYDGDVGVAVGPDGRVHVLGGTRGAVATHEGFNDIYVITFDRDGRELWRLQRGARESDYAEGIATDADGNLYVTGATYGSLGGIYKGYHDGFVLTFDNQGRDGWKRHPATYEADYPTCVATDPDGSVYVAGFTSGSLGGSQKGGEDAFIIKYDRDGRILRRRQPGTTSSDNARGIATDAEGNVYVVGNTQGALGGAYKGGDRWPYGDAFVIKYDRDGRILWKRQPGTNEADHAFGVATDSDGNVFVVGTTYGALAGPYKGGGESYGDAFVIKFDADGRIVWKRQRGTPGSDVASGVATDADGNAYVVGGTEGEFGGLHQGNTDAFVLKFDRDGTLVWSDQPGTPSSDWASGVATDTDGNAYVAGSTFGSLPDNTNLGESDAFLIKYGPGGPR